MSGVEATLQMPERTPMDPSKEAAASKLWAVYVSEAEKYDKSLVESWKSDMEGMLIFAGLFSASLTAFLIESYKTLVPDSGDSTVQILTQISQQLAAAANGSTFEPPAPIHFTPSTSSFICNALWFLSLGLSLTCALIATLVEQWARDFLHKADMRSSPFIRARIFSYLYYGLKRFKMHTVVDIIPLLLHTSLFLFLAGLVAFLLPINISIATVAAVLSAVMVAAYTLLTMLPVWFLNCPYRTPLSTAFWGISQTFASIWLRTPFQDSESQADPSSKSTMVEAMSQRATEKSAGRFLRDYRALEWTVKSLADDTEFEPFVEGLPDVLWGPVYRRYGYEDYIHKLMRNPDLRLQHRIESLLRSCDSGLLSLEATKRRRITCYKALWAIAGVQPRPGFSDDQSLDFTLLCDFLLLHKPGLEVLHYSVSALAHLRWSTFRSMKSYLATLVEYLVQCKAEAEAGHTPNLKRVAAYLRSSSLDLFPASSRLRNYLSKITAASPPLSLIILELIQAIEEFGITTPYQILFQYFEDSAQLQSEPYRWDSTLNVISIPNPADYSAFGNMLEAGLGRVVNRCHFSDSSEVVTNFNDIVVDTFCRYWRPDEPVPIPHGIITYLNNRNAVVLNQLLCTERIGLLLWSSFPITLSHGPSSPQAPHSILLDEVKTALWSLARITPTLPTSVIRYSPAIYEPVLAAVEAFSNTSPVIFSLNCMLKSRLVDSLLCGSDSSSRGRVPPLRHPSLPTATAIVVPPEFLEAQVVDSPESGFLEEPVDPFHRVLQCRIIEAKIGLVAEFLDGIRPDFIPYRAGETLRYLCDNIPTPRSEIHETHQTRFASGIRRVFESGKPDNMNLLDTIIKSEIFEPYFDAGLYQVAPDVPVNSHSGYAWLQDLSACSRIQEMLEKYSKALISPDAPSVPARIQAILAGLELLQTTVDTVGVK
ncbi:hypothetical protein MVEN_00446500 [Mycena venus]|uniref:DUF6535 domain-containing protein n=1 Tax=Mycena venus TaxID=2733690 RepID=A0A8H7DB87_9AGAR|nr:hypothetical protein MVEN_00446500 [Mycena venus]